MGPDGSVSASSAEGKGLSLTSGSGTTIRSSGVGGGEAVVDSLKVRSDRVVSPVTAHLSGTAAPADERIAVQERDAPPPDRDAIMQRAMSVPVKSFTYSEEWRRISGLGEESVRALIGQEVAEVMPEWVTVMDELSFAEQGFALQQFQEVNDRQVLYDTLLSLQAQHERLKLGPNEAGSSGRLDISTADAGAYAGAAPSGDGSSGELTLKTGTASGGGASGDLVMGTGASHAGRAGGVQLTAGAGTGSDGVGGDIRMAAGSTALAGAGGELELASGASEGGTGGDVEMTSGGGVASGAASLSTGDASSGSSGGIELRSGTSTTGPAGAVSISGGAIAVAGGANSDGVGGALGVTTGASTAGGSSGEMALSTAGAADEAGALVRRRTCLCGAKWRGG